MIPVQDLEGAKALVTGGGTGVGLGITRCLLRHGARVATAARRLEVLDAAAEKLRAEIPGAEIQTLRCDVTVEEDVAAAVTAAADGGGLDVAVANAGTGALGPILLAKPEDWRRVFDLNVVGTLLTIKHAAHAMKDSGRGSIVAISSVAGVLVEAWLGPYSPSKAALEMLVRLAAVELGPMGIRVNAVRPGLVMQEHVETIVQVPGMRENMEAITPLRLEGSGEEIGEAIAYLSGPRGTWVTGQVFSVDGGHSIPQGASFEPVVRMAFPELITGKG